LKVDRIEDCISFLAGKAAQQVTRRARELLAPFDVTPVQYAVLKILAGTEGMSGADIGARIVLDSASVTGVVDRLEESGLVKRRRDPKDRRVHQITATPRAEELMSSLDSAMDRLNEEAAAILGGQSVDFRQRLQRLGDQKRWQ
jgi:DNA-binding MarR family transcriptional regulator